MSNKFLRTPTTFEGKSGECAKKWFEEFDRISTCNRWANGQKLQIFPAFLKGKAAQFFEDSQVPEEGEQLSYNDYKDLFLREFENVGEADQAWNNLNHCRQSDDEAVTDFGAEIVRLSKIAYPCASPETLDAIQRRHFFHQCTGEIKQAMLGQNFESFSDMVKFSKRVESSYGSLKQERHNVEHLEIVASLNRRLETLEDNKKVQFSGDSRMDDLERKIDKIEQMMESLTSRNSGTHSNQYIQKAFRPSNAGQFAAKSTYRCFNCGKIGHIAKNCRGPSSPGPSPRFSFQSKNV